MIRKKSSGHGGHRNNRGRKFRSGGGSGGGGHNDSQSLARQKKHAMTQKDKFTALARDAQANGDRVNAEYYYQHVEHYVRTIADIEEREPQPQPPRERHVQNGDGVDNTDMASADESDDAEGEPVAQDSRSHHRPTVRPQEADDIPLPTGLFGADDADTERAANG